MKTHDTRSHLRTRGAHGGLRWQAEAEVATEAPGRYRYRHAARSDGIYRGCGR